MHRFPGKTLLEKIEPYWGLVRGDDSRKPAFESFKTAYRNVLESGSTARP